MGLFSKVADTLGLGGGQDLGQLSEDAFRRETARLNKLKITKRKEAQFLETEGQGMSEAASFSFGDETDLEDLTQEERTQRSTGRRDTGLIL